MADFGYISLKMGFDKSSSIRSIQRPRDHIHKVGLDEPSIINGLGFLSVGSYTYLNVDSHFFKLWTTHITPPFREIF